MYRATAPTLDGLTWRCLSSSQRDQLPISTVGAETPWRAFSTFSAALQRKEGNMHRSLFGSACRVGLLTATAALAAVAMAPPANADSLTTAHATTLTPALTWSPS